MSRSNQKGIALILTLILLAVMSVMAVSLMFLSQSETWSSLNYRLMSQSRDGAEAGINSAANYIVNTYTQPGGVSDPTTGYTNTVSPVTCCGAGSVMLTTISGDTSNYPVSSVITAFNTTGVGKGSITAGNTTINYNTEATLLSMHTAFRPFGSAVPTTVQTWKIVSDGSISTIRNAKVEVSAILERHVTPTFYYAAFATSQNCDALDFSGGGSTGSYNSNTVVNGTVTTQNSGGNLGTDGNLTSSNSTTINGSLSTPRTGVGNCANGSPDAWSGNGTITGGIVHLPQIISYPPPSLPNPIPPVSNLQLSSSTSCGGVIGCTWVSTGGNTGYFTLSPCPTSGCTATSAGTYGQVAVQSGNTLHLSAGTYDMDAFSMTGNSNIVVDSGPVILNISGCATTSGSACASYITTPIDTTGGTVSNPSLISGNFQVLYAGTGTVKLSGGSQTAMGLAYAPNATINISGGAPWYGALIGNTVKDTGGAAIYYDRALDNSAFTIGNWMLDSFTWRKY
jgi:Tfp pilus assembly protein PilX